MIKEVNQKFICIECSKSFNDGYELLKQELCLDCLRDLNISITAIMRKFQLIEQKKCNDRMEPILEEALEYAKNMTQEEYEKLLAKCSPLDKEWQSYAEGWDDDE